VRYLQALAAWLDDAASDGGALHDASEALSAEARRRRVEADELLRMVKAGLPRKTGRADVAESAEELGRASRYVTAVEILLSTFFGDAPPPAAARISHSTTRPPMDQQVRYVTDGDQRAWRVFVVQEGMRWDPEIEMRRANWLCCAAVGEQRYISPVPDGWEEWTDEILLEAIAQAPPDLRGPR
jgi:hypothetical protein